MARKSLARVVVGAVGRALVDKRLPLGRRFAVLGGFLASGTRLALGTYVGRLGPRPAQPLILYEFEGCPFCRKAREALTLLDLDVHIRPCPKNGKRFRPELVARAGKAQFPYLIDPNTGAEMYESSAIVRYLYQTYGAGKPPAYLLSAVATQLSGAACAALNAGHGVFATPARRPEKELELYSYEASPFSRFARQALCELELPYLLHNHARGSPRRAAFKALSGRLQFPYLIDPNTGTAMFESYAIEQYLRLTYAS